MRQAPNQTLAADRRVFVVGAGLPGGGADMARCLGRIISETWGWEFVAVALSPEEEAPSVWPDESQGSKIALEEMKQQARREDILVCNPSFSQFLLGLSFPGKKLMYVQGVNTFEVLDGFFDKYVAASPFVKNFILRTYGMELPVIPPFIHHDHGPALMPVWEARPAHSTVFGLKAQGRRFFDHFNAVMATRHPSARYEATIIPERTPHRAFLEILAGHRHFLWLAPVEGFGLPPLEAMMCGASVAGFHGGGGSYFRPGENALVCGYPDFHRLADLFAQLLADETLARKLAENGKRTAAAYTFERFRRAWIETLSPWLDP